MKRTLLYILVMSLLSLTALCQTTIPNTGFETWIDAESPDSWDASNIHEGFINIVTVTQSTESYSGTYSAKLESMQVMAGFPINPGFITLGTFWYTITPQDGGASGGIPFNGRPDSLAGYYKTDVMSGDKTSMYMYLWTGTDTIGSGSFENSNSVANWSSFSFPVSYSAPDTPDSLNIIFSSSDFYNSGNIEDGSLLYIDELSLIYGSTSIVNLNYNEHFVVYADAATNDIIVALDFDTQTDALISIYSISGQQFYSNQLTLSQHKEIIPLNNYAKGVYLVEVITADGMRFAQKIALK